MKHEDYKRLQRDIQANSQTLIHAVSNLQPNKRVDSISISTRGKGGGNITVIYRDIVTVPLFGEITEGDM